MDGCERLQIWSVVRVNCTSNSTSVPFKKKNIEWFGSMCSAESWIWFMQWRCRDSCASFVRVANSQQQAHTIGVRHWSRDLCVYIQRLATWSRACWEIIIYQKSVVTISPTSVIFTMAFPLAVNTPCRSFSYAGNYVTSNLQGVVSDFYQFVWTLSAPHRNTFLEHSIYYNGISNLSLYCP